MIKKKKLIFNFNSIRLKFKTIWNNLNFLFYNFQRKYLKLFKFFDQRKIGSIPRVLISSVIIVSFFYIVPIINNYKNNNLFNTKEYQNNSKAVLAYTLNKKNNGVDADSKNINEKDLLFDIFSLNDLETDTVRLNASTIKQLFDETDYKLKDVRETKLVKPVALTLLPNEIKMIENTTERKEFFIQIVLPLILEENNNIRSDRRTLFGIINKSNNTNLEKKWLEKKYKQYGVVSKDLSVLKIRMDIVPVSLAIAQAAKETGWGTSRFAQEGNALFGQWTWSGEGLKPKEAEETQGHKVMKFNVLQASVRAYQRNLNTHRSYKNFRLARAELRDREKPLDSLILSKFLNNYAETGDKYVEVLQKIIKQNSLKDFDDSKLLPSSKDLESLT
jgi:Bax protein